MTPSYRSLNVSVCDTVLQKAAVCHIDVCIDVLFGSALSRTLQPRSMALIQPAGRHIGTLLLPSLPSLL